MWVLIMTIESILKRIDDLRTELNKLSGLTDYRSKSKIEILVSSIKANESILRYLRGLK